MTMDNLTLNGISLPSANGSIPYYNHTITLSDIDNDFEVNQIQNDTTTPSGTEKFRDIGYLILFGLTSIVGLVGNSMVCKVVFSKGAKRNFTNLLLVNLAISDVTCVSIFFIDLVVCSEYFMLSIGEGACTTAKIIQMLSFQVSSVTMTIIAIDRFLLVYYPLVRKHRRLPLHYLMPFVWILSFVVVLIASPRYTMFKLFTSDDLHGGFIKCEVKDMFPEHALTPHNVRLRILLATTGLFWLPQSIILICYCSIAWKVMHRNVGTMTTSQQEILLRRKWKTIKMLIASVAVFFLCWAPLMILNFFEALGHLDSAREKLCSKKSVFVGIAFWLVYSSSCYNPFVYWIYSEEFRGGLKEAWNAVGKYFNWCERGGCCCGVASSESELNAVSRENSQSTNIESLSMKST